MPYVSRYLGETQITDGDGRVLARMTCEDGEGVITADITPGKVAGERAPIPENFWTGELPSMAAKAWEHLNPARTAILRRDRPPDSRRRLACRIGC